MMTLNVNAKVKVKLTKRGAEILNSDTAKWESSLHQRTSCATGGPTPKVEGDYWEGPLWDLMNIWGQFLYNGCDISFVDNVLHIDAGAEAEARTLRTDYKETQKPVQRFHAGDPVEVLDRPNHDVWVNAWIVKANRNGTYDVNVCDANGYNVFSSSLPAARIRYPL